MIIFHYPFSVFHLNAWPVCLTFGGKQVMCDGKAELVFPINRGARYDFSVSGGELASVSVPGVETRDMAWLDWYHPWDFSVGDVSVHQESASEGWLGSLASVEVDGLDVTHFFDDDQKQIVAELQNCHEDAYRGCAWSGGPGITFSNVHSLATVISWQTVDSVQWATNYVTLVTTYEGDYVVTNSYVVSVGLDSEPPTILTVGCPAVQFVNDGIGGDRPERVYKIVLKLQAPLGTRGRVALSCNSSAGTTLYNDESQMQPVAPQETIPLEIPTSGGFDDDACIYMTSTNLGIGTVSAVLNIEDGGGEHEESVPFEVIEPIRKLVNTAVVEGHVVNPPCVVSGGEALLKKESYPTDDGGTRLDLSRQLLRLTDTYTRQDCIEVYFIGDLSNSRAIGVRTDFGVIITKAATSQTLAHELAHVLGLADCYEKSNGQLIDHGNEPVTKERFKHYDRDWGMESGRGFYEKDDTLVKIIQSYLMNGISMAGRIDIPHGAVHAWAKKDQNVKDFIHVGARYLKPSWEVYSK